MSNSSENILAFLAGTAIGAGLGVLFAPDKGSNTRAKIKDGFDDLKYQAKSKWNAMEKEAKEDLKETVIKLISGSSHIAQEVANFLEEKLEELKNKDTNPPDDATPAFTGNLPYKDSFGSE